MFAQFSNGCNTAVELMPYIQEAMGLNHTRLTFYYIYILNRLSFIQVPHE